jgi:uncharacterized protein (TIGR03435 family)
VVVMAAQLALGQGSAEPSKQSLDPTRTGSPGTPVDGAHGSAGATALAAYDVVSVKAQDPNQKITDIRVENTPDGIHASGPLGMLLRVAYGSFKELPTDDSVVGLPDWARTQIFNVDAKMSPEQVAAFAKLDKQQQEAAREAMLQALLEDRFQLKIHREPKQVSDYELVVAKGGPKLKEGGNPDPNGPKDKDGKPLAGSFLMMRKSGQVEAQGLGMESLANFLGQGALGIGRMVKDQTGLAGKYTFTLNWSQDPGMGGGTMDGVLKAPAANADENLPSIFTALQEQLGLKLQPGTGTINTVVVEHVERPSAD